MVILVVDRKASLAIELDEDKVEPQSKWEMRGEGKRVSSHRMIKLATYSGNKSTVLSYISIFESLWKEIELNEKITSLLEEIKRREIIEQDFINMAAHELRAAIQPVLGLAQILQTKKNVDAKEQEELLSVIIRNARRLNILTENLLDLAKIESNTLAVQKELFNLPELIFEAIADMKSQLSSNQVIINVEYNNNNGSAKIDLDNIPPCMVEADKIRIMQVISNLLTNAIKFTRGGRVVIRLDDNISKERTTNSWDEIGENLERGEAQGEEAKKDVTVSFIDSGSGIHPEILGKIFEKFVTKSDKGTGLGLFISKKDNRSSRRKNMGQK